MTKKRKRRKMMPFFRKLESLCFERHPLYTLDKNSISAAIDISKANRIHDLE